VSRIDRAFERLRAERRMAFIAYVCAGDPSLEATAKIVETLQSGGADVVELGVPFSDPIADGPTIQAASQRALQRGATVRGVLKLVRTIRERSEVPLALMGYYNPIFHYGEERFVADAARAGVDGLIIPDLSPEEAKTLIAAARQHDVSTIFFIAPTSTPERIRLAHESSTGFIYCTSVTGITGARRALPTELKAGLGAIRRMTDKPLAVGFGISRPEQVRMLRGYADGVIVGSAICNVIAEGAGKPMKATLERVGRLVRSLARETKR
jgi:tryptophan synthase alpha chain